MISVDSSVLIAGFSSWHGHHAAARRAINGARMVGHTLLEAYSVLTRLPAPFRVPADVVATFLATITTEPPLVPDAETLGGLPGRLAADGITGGAVYDALVAVTSASAGAELVSLDARAAMTYQAMGVRYRMLA